MEVQPAGVGEVGTYTVVSQAAQAWLRGRGLAQYVPAAHDEYATAIRLQAESGTLYAVRNGGAAVGFFSLDTTPSPWWPADAEPALYLAGMVVSQQARGCGVGSRIIQWCVAEAGQRRCEFVRLECHADNSRLCAYYESHGFHLEGRIEMYPAYLGCLYQRAVTPPGRVGADGPMNC